MADAREADRGPALGAERVLAWVEGARTGLAQARAGIDALNVFPVADADTGTNAWLTVEGGARAVDERVAEGPAPAADLLTAFSRGAMLAARGNSGVILSQWLAGFARRTEAVLEARGLADALRDAARAARLALADPQEGTVLSLADEVARAAHLTADALPPGAPGSGPGAVAAHAAAAGHQALARISAAHPVLRRAHVPDAGACALLVVLDALAAALGGGPARDAAGWLPGAAGTPGTTGTRGMPDERARSEAEPGHEAGAEGAAHRFDGHGGAAFEVMLVVRVPDGSSGGPGPHHETGDRLRTALGGTGESVAVVGADGWWHAHVHTDDPAAAIAACAVGGGCVREQVVVRRLDVVDSGVLPAADWRLVVVTTTAGLAAWYATAGAVVVVRAPEAPVTTSHVRRAVEDADGRALVLTSGAVAPDVVEPLLEGATGTAGTVELVATPDDVRSVIAALAFVTRGAGPGGVAAAALAAARARVATIDVPAAGPVAADRLDELVGNLAAAAADEDARDARGDSDSGGGPETLTAIVPLGSDGTLVGRLEDAAARHGLEATVLAAEVAAVQLAVD